MNGLIGTLHPSVDFHRLERRRSPARIHTGITECNSGDLWKIGDASGSCVHGERYP